MKRLSLALALMAGCCLAAASGSLARAAAVLCVGGPGCYSTLQAAVDAAHDGDSITIASGTYAGGVTIDVSVRLVGAGANQTVISGGGPVLTIGSFGSSSEPTVSIEGVTITGGVTRSSPESMPFVGQEGVFALGGGVEIPPNADFTGGATVTITDSVITGNRVAPTATLPFGPPCPNGPCPFALAAGGGIDNWGTLTLDGATISNNRVGTASGLSALASDAHAGAIQNWLGPLTISNSIISGNQASATAPNGRFADSGAIFAEGGTLTMTGSSVTNNSATLNAALPNSVDLLAVAGGIHISNQAAGSIRNTTISGNSAIMTNTVGDANAFSGGVHTDVNVELSNDVITNNSVNVSTLGRSHGHGQLHSRRCDRGRRRHDLRRLDHEQRHQRQPRSSLEPTRLRYCPRRRRSGRRRRHYAAKLDGEREHRERKRPRRVGSRRRYLRRSRAEWTTRWATRPHRQQRHPQHLERKHRNHAPGRRHLRDQPGLANEQRNRRQHPRPMLRLLNGGTLETSRPARVQVSSAPVRCRRAPSSVAHEGSPPIWGLHTRLHTHRTIDAERVDLAGRSRLPGLLQSHLPDSNRRPLLTPDR